MTDPIGTAQERELIELIARAICQSEGEDPDKMIEHRFPPEVERFEAEVPHEYCPEGECWYQSEGEYFWHWKQWRRYEPQALAVADALQSRIAEVGRLEQRVRELEAREELSDRCAKIEADAVSGLHYIERRYGRLEGVGWDRVFDAHDELFARAALSLHRRPT